MPELRGCRRSPGKTPGEERERTSHDNAMKSPSKSPAPHESGNKEELGSLRTHFSQPKRMPKTGF